MSTHTLYTDYAEAAAFLKANDARPMGKPVKYAGGMDTTYELIDGTVVQEHDCNNEPYTLDLVITGEGKRVAT